MPRVASAAVSRLGSLPEPNIVADFGPLTVTMDAHGGDLYENVRSRVSENIKAMRFK
jgi:hypothetical protein